jgi:hypothetical protein
LFEIIVLKIRTGELTEKKNRKETETRHGNWMESEKKSYLDGLRYYD